MVGMRGRTTVPVEIRDPDGRVHRLGHTQIERRPTPYPRVPPMSPDEVEALGREETEKEESPEASASSSNETRPNGRSAEEEARSGPEEMDNDADSEAASSEPQRGGCQPS